MMERATGLEPRSLASLFKGLCPYDGQTSACYPENLGGVFPPTPPPPVCTPPGEKVGAGNGTRTRDLQLGKLTFYQLNYARSNLRYEILRPKDRPAHKTVGKDYSKNGHIGPINRATTLLDNAGNATFAGRPPPWADVLPTKLCPLTLQLKVSGL